MSDPGTWIRCTDRGFVLELLFVSHYEAESKVEQLLAAGIEDAHVVDDPATEIGSHLKLTDAELTTFRYVGAGGVSWFPGRTGERRDKFTRPYINPKTEQYKRVTCSRSAWSLVGMKLIQVPDYGRPCGVDLTPAGEIVLNRIKEAAKP